MVAASIPLAFLIAVVLFINQFQDYAADKVTGKHNLVVRLGRARSSIVFAAILAASYVSLIVGVAAFGVSPFALLPLLTMPLVWKAGRTARRFHDDYLRLTPAIPDHHHGPYARRTLDDLGLRCPNKSASCSP